MKTMQECFDITCQHLMTQRVAAVKYVQETSADECAYRTTDGSGNTCAVGKWIDDDKYIPEMEGKKVHFLIKTWPDRLPQEIVENERLFSELQYAHDHFLKKSVTSCASTLKEIAIKHNLTVPECVTKELEAA